MSPHTNDEDKYEEFRQLNKAKKRRLIMLGGFLFNIVILVVVLLLRNCGG